MEPSQSTADSVGSSLLSAQTRQAPGHDTQSTATGTLSEEARTTQEQGTATSGSSAKVTRFAPVKARDDDYETLLQARQDLVRAKLSNPEKFGRSEQLKLQRIRWQLDMIEAAHSARGMEQLKSFATEFSGLARSVDSLVRQMNLDNE